MGGRFEGMPVDRSDGFIHFSTADQVAETARRHFCAQADLLLIAYDQDIFGDSLKWEPSRDGALFPHVYGPINPHQALWARPLTLRDDGEHDFSSIAG